MPSEWEEFQAKHNLCETSWLLILYESGNNFWVISSNKIELIKFLVGEWKLQKYKNQLQNRVLFITCKDVCYQVSSQSVVLMPTLQCSHEEAETRLLFHAYHAAQHRFSTVIIHSEDTDVFVIALHSIPTFKELGCKILFKRWKCKSPEILWFVQHLWLSWPWCLFCIARNACTNGLRYCQCICRQGQSSCLETCSNQSWYFDYTCKTVTQFRRSKRKNGKCWKICVSLVWVEEGYKHRWVKIRHILC